LEAINQSLKAAIAKQTQTQTKLRSNHIPVSARPSSTQNSFPAGKDTLSEIQQLQAERQELIEQRNAVKAQIAQRDGDQTGSKDFAARSGHSQARPSDCSTGNSPQELETQQGT